MMGLILAGTMVLTPNGPTYIAPMGNGNYNIVNDEGITQVRNFNGYQQIVEPNGDTTNIWSQGGKAGIEPILPVGGQDGDGQ
jgi:hypothetical protein